MGVIEKMLPSLLVEIALVIIIVWCGYQAFSLMQLSRRPWFKILFYLSVLIVALSMLL
jgi:hypothetical protein